MLHIFALSLTILIYIAIAASHYGWGAITTHLLGLQKQKQCIATSYVWIGWAFTIFIFQLIHFILPLKGFIIIPIFIIGFVFTIPNIVTSYRRWFSQSTRLSRSKLLFIVAVGLTVSAWIASRAMLPPNAYDSGLYHLNAVRWINSYPIIPGLGNLHGRLAFNQTFFLYVAALNFYPLFGNGRSIANSFLFLLTIATAFDLLRPVFKKPSILLGSHPFQYISIIFMFPILAYLAFTSEGIASPSPDLTSSLLQISMFMFFVNGIGYLISGQHEQDHAAMLLVILAATAVTIKLSNLAFSTVIYGFVLTYAWKKSRKRIRRVIYFALPVIVLFTIWCVRGFVLSGAPLYPSTIGYIPIDWAVPREKVIDEANWIYSWARQTHTHWSIVLGSWNWFEPWILKTSKNIIGVIYPFSVFIIFCIFALIISIFKKGRKLEIIELAILSPLLVSLFYWFFTAPDPRFSNAIFFLMPISAILITFTLIQDRFSVRLFVIIVFIAFISANLNFITYAVKNYREIKSISTSGWYSVKEIPLDKRITNSGLIVYIPKTDYLCWDAPLPCAPLFNDTLRLRKSGDIASGFTVKE